MKNKIREWILPLIFTLILGAIAFCLGIQSGRKEKELKQEKEKLNTTINKLVNQLEVVSRRSEF